MDLIKITIVNYEKFNPRNDRTNHVWFRLQNNFFEDQVIYSLSSEQQRLFVFLLCLASKDNAAHFQFSPRFSAAILNRRADLILKDLSALVTSGLVLKEKMTDDGRPDAGLAPDGVLATLQTNKTDKQNKTDSATSGAPRLNAAATAPVIAAFKKFVSLKLFNSWLEAYGDEKWIHGELAKAQAWIHANPRKSPKKDIARFLNNWLARGWENYRKTIPSAKQPSTWLQKKLSENPELST